MRVSTKRRNSVIKSAKALTVTGLAIAALSCGPMLQAQPEEMEYLQGLQRMGLGDVLESYTTQKLESSPDDANSILWRTELAKKKLDDNGFTQPLPYGAEFFLFGMCYNKQMETVDKNATEALELLNGASGKWFEMKSMLPRTEDFEMVWVDTGRWETLENFYGKLFLPYYSANARILVAMRGPASAYMVAKAEKEGFNYDAERRQLLNGAIGALNGMKADLDQYRPPTRAGVYISLAQAYALNGQASQGLSAINTALAMNSQVDERTKSSRSWRRMMIMATLTKSLVQEKMGQKDDAIKTVETLLSKNPGTFSPALTGDGNDVLYALIAGGRIGVIHAMNNEGGKQYDGFKMVSADPRWNRYKNNIFDTMFRLIVPAQMSQPVDPSKTASTQPGGEEGDLPALQAYAKAMRNWNNAIGIVRGDKEKAKPMFVEAIKFFDMALRGKDTLGEGPTKDAMFYKGYCYYYLGKALDSSKAFLDYAKAYPPMNENPKSREIQAINAAIKFALDVYNQTYASQPKATRNPQGLAYFLEVVDFIQKAGVYDDKGTLNGMYVVAASAHYENGDMEEAVKWYRLAEQKGEDLVDAKVGLMFIYYEQWQEASGQTARDLRSKVKVTAEGLQKEIEKDLPSVTDADRKRDLTIYLGQAMIYEAEALTDDGSAGAVGEAVELIRVLETDPRWANDKGMYREGIRIKIKALQALGKYGEIASEVKAIVAKEPQLAGTLLLPVLNSLEDEISRLEKRGQKDKASQMGTAALAIAVEVKAWAEKFIPELTGKAFDDKQRLYYDLIVAKSTVSSGKYGEAIASLNALKEKHGNQLTILAALADAYMRKGGANDEHEAVKLYNEIIEGLDQMGVRNKLYPDWQAKAAALGDLTSIEEPTKDQQQQIREASQALEAARDLVLLYWVANYEVLEAVERSSKGKRPEIARRILFLQKRVDDRLGRDFDRNISSRLEQLLNKHAE